MLISSTLILLYFFIVMLMKPCMTLCGMVLLSIYICVDHGHEGKLINIWMYGYDDHFMCNLCLVFYSSCESRLCYYCYEYDSDYVRVICRCCH